MMRETTQIRTLACPLATPNPDQMIHAIISGMTTYIPIQNAATKKSAMCHPVNRGPYYAT